MARRSSQVGSSQAPLTAYFTSASAAKGSKKKKQKPQLATPRPEANEAGPSKKKVKKKENNSPVASPQTTPRKRRRGLKTLGSETNVLDIEDTPVGEEQKAAEAERDVIDLTDPPTSNRVANMGLPTPLTMPKRRGGRMVEHTPTPTHFPHHKQAKPLPDSMMTPQLPHRPAHTLQQPTPSTPSLIQNNQAGPSSPAPLPRSLLLQPAKAFSPSRLKSCSFILARQQPQTPKPHEIVPSSQSQDLEWNPFMDNTSAAEPAQTKKDSLSFKLPHVPLHIPTPPSPTRKAPGTPSSRRLEFKLPLSPASALRKGATKPSMDEIVPTSQPGEEELVLPSPLREQRTPAVPESPGIVPTSQPGEEELVLPSLFGTPHKRKSVPSATISPKAAQAAPEFASPSRRQQMLSFVVSPKRLAPPDFLSSRPSTPKRPRIVSNLPGPAGRASTPSPPRKAFFVPSTPPRRSPAADSGLGTSVSPEKLQQDSSQTEPESSQTEPESSQTEPESSQTEPESSQTEPESPQPAIDSQASSQTEPESPQPAIDSQASSQTEPESPRWRVSTQVSPSRAAPAPPAASSQTEPESSQWRVHSSPPRAPAGFGDSSQTEPESSQWLVRTPPRSPPRGLPDDPDADVPCGSLPVAEYESQEQAEAAREEAFWSSPPRPAAGKAGVRVEELDSPSRRVLAQRLQYVRGRLGEKECDSDTPFSVPSDFDGDEDVVMGGLGSSDLHATPLKEFLEMF